MNEAVDRLVGQMGGPSVTQSNKWKQDTDKRSEYFRASSQLYVTILVIELMGAIRKGILPFIRLKKKKAFEKEPNKMP